MVAEIHHRIGLLCLIGLGREMIKPNYVRRNIAGVIVRAATRQIVRIIAERLKYSAVAAIGRILSTGKGSAPVGDADEQAVRNTQSNAR